MDFEGALRSRLTAAGAVTALVGARVYWVDRPQSSALPGITLQLVDDQRGQHFGGFHTLQRAVVQIDVWATTYASGKAIKEAVIAALVPEVTANGIEFQRAFITARDLSERTETAFIHRPSLDFTFHYSAA